ncbi:unnamed protein product [Adineta steineri]|uniref:Uncharacterized protein n=1 Tax=Adineta steineri TaxID=433720 RepID=A0A815MV43_9BILA|nr:unnamed protein product [Adineta steineri]CAF1623233.1 unnamed protein product [Adineta steineri]
MPLHMHGNNNYFTVTDTSKIQNDETLFHKASNQFGKVFESGTDMVISLAEWLGHIQENWYIAKLGKLEKKCESEYDETAEAIQELKESLHTEATSTEKAADNRDAILAKHFRKFT